MSSCSRQRQAEPLHVLGNKYTAISRFCTIVEGQVWINISTPSKRVSRHCTLVVLIITFFSSFFSRSPSTVDLSQHRFLSILGLFPVMFLVFVFILLRFDSQSSLSVIQILSRMVPVFSFFQD